jgi:hypothetical protein
MGRFESFFDRFFAPKRSEISVLEHHKHHLMNNIDGFLDPFVTLAGGGCGLNGAYLHFRRKFRAAQSLSFIHCDNFDELTRKNPQKFYAREVGSDSWFTMPPGAR